MKILFLTPRIPYPPFRGDKLKIWNLLRLLAQKHEIVLVTFIQSKQEEEYVQPLRELCKEVHVVYLPRWKSIINCLIAVFQLVPFQVAYYRSKAMSKLLGEILDRVHPDLLHTHLIRMAQYAAHLSAIPRVLDLTDAVSLYLARFAEAHYNPIVKNLVRWELDRMRIYEPVLAQFDRALVCSVVDRDFLLRSVPSAKIDLLYNGVDLAAFSMDGSLNPLQDRIIFTGNMSYYPNADAAMFFSDEILPLIHEVIPGAKFYIVGQDPPRSVKALASEHIVITGFVKDIREEYLKSTLAVSPIRFGAGTLNKILEPLALGVPVVSTVVGVDGLGLTFGKDILVAHTPYDFARDVVAVLKDKTYRRTLGSSARKKIRRRFGWATVVQDLDRIYGDVLKARGVRTSPRSKKLAGRKG